MLEILLSCLFLSATRGTPVPAGQDPSPLRQVFVAREWLVIEPVDARGRRPVRPDAVFAKHLLDPDAPPPRADEVLAGERGEQTWERLEADEKGNVGGRRGWGYTEVEWERDEILIAELRGAWTLFVNGAGFAGDAYRYGFKGFPIELREGKNHVYVTGIRGAFRLRLFRPGQSLFLGDWDVTRPDLLRGTDAPRSFEFALPVVNASAEPLRLVPSVGHPSSADFFGFRRFPFEFTLPPLSIAKATLSHNWIEEDLDDLHLEVHLRAEDDPRLTAAKAEVTFGCVSADQPHLRTFRSAIDGSLQEYGLRPATELPTDERPHGVVISCHGAGVGCRGQSNAYGVYEDLWIAVPTNRRPYGFDWQDWGRLDAYEVLERAMAISGAGEDRVYLTGHSMGGHGAWSIAANDPDRWAAVAPSAGWASFDTYGGRPEGELASYWHAADGTSLTFTLIDNLAQLPTFVLHGEKDDNVPPTEARAMIAALEKAGAKPASHFEPGKGHWWDAGQGPGADCLTWPGIFELFTESRRESAPHEVRFTSIDPVVDSEHHFVQVYQPLEYGTPISVTASFDVETRTLTLETENVRALSLGQPGEVAAEKVSLDETVHAWEHLDERLHLAKIDGEWQPTWLHPPLEWKGPHRSGPFKRAFDRRFLLVYGTAGDERTDRELLERARHDGAEWLYRANGSPPVISDEDFLGASPEKVAGRNVILYGNRDTNRAWKQVLPEDAPVRAGLGWIEIGERRWEGDDLSCLFVYPRKGSSECLVGAFADSGVRGARLGYTSGKFVSGVGIPDLLLCDSSVLAEGDGGVLAAGWFDHRWSWNGGFVERGSEARGERDEEEK